MMVSKLYLALSLNMRKNRFKQYLILFTFIILIISCGEESSTKNEKLIHYVDPIIGTGGHGHTYPGATIPFGMVQLSPDTRMENWDGSSGYHESDKTIMGFSHTHLSGTGAPEFCDILFMPTTGKVNVLVGDEEDSETGYRSKFSHKNEFASPGYYKVLLDDYNVTAELTATNRTGFHRYTFPKSEASNIIIDLLNRDRVIDSEMNIINNTEISGSRRSTRWAKDQHVYFYAKFSKPFTSVGIAIDDKIVENIKTAKGKNIKGFVNFTTNEGESILVKVGISSVSIDGARKNLDTENTAWEFDNIKNAAEQLWENHLSKIEIEGGTEKQKRIFYTSLYHTALAPVTLNDVDGKYRAGDRNIHKVDSFTRYTVWSLWDVFRTQMPLYTIIEPSRMNEYMKTFLEIYKVTGRLPHWEIWGEHSGSMIGHHSLPIILDAYTKGIRDFDVELAFKAMKNQVDQNGAYSNFGYIPDGSVSEVMEYSYNDWCIAEMAKQLGEEKDYLHYQKRAQFYKNLFDQTTGFMRPRNSDGSWLTPFDPTQGTHHFVEGNSYQYSLFAPHDINSLIDSIGGDEKFDKWLDELFSIQSKHDNVIVDATGLIGQYAHGNEPSHHMAYLYNYIGKPWKTQAMISQILETLYNDQPNGISGNEDCGQMSAWYIMSAMGFYPVCPGDPTYAFGSPIFDKVTINLENGKKFTVKAENASKNNKYIQSVTLNDKDYNSSWFKHEDIMNGSTLVFKMGDTPNKKWGTLKNSRPLTKPLQAFVKLPYAITSDINFLHKGKVALKCDDKEALLYFTTDGTNPTKKSIPYKKPIVVNKTTQIRFTAFKEGMLSSTPISIQLNKLEFVNYTNYTNKLELVPGLHYKYYHAHVINPFELDDLKPLETGIISRITADERQREDYFGYAFEGYLKIPKDGIYTISISSNDGNVFFLDDKKFEGGAIAIRKGKYKIAQKYFQLGNNKWDIVSWEGPGIKKQEIPASAYFHKNN